MNIGCLNESLKDLLHFSIQIVLMVLCLVRVSFDFVFFVHFRAVQQLNSGLKATTITVVYSTTFSVSDTLLLQRCYYVRYCGRCCVVCCGRVVK